MPSVLLDTNVVVSAVLFRGPSHSLVQAALTGGLDLVTSDFLLDELESVLVRKFSFSVEVAREVRRELEVLATIVVPGEIPDICRGPDGNQVLAAAVAGAAEVIVTGDKDLLDLGSFSGIGIVEPAVYLRRLTGTRRPR